MVRPLGMLVAGVLALFVSGAAQAHGALKRTMPRAGSVVQTAPTDVTLWFSERIEPAFSTITVSNAAGERVDTGRLQREGENASSLQVGLGPLAPGTYTVTWRAVSVDTHSTSGSFVFEVRPK